MLHGLLDHCFAATLFFYTYQGKEGVGYTHGGYNKEEDA